MPRTYTVEFEQQSVPTADGDTDLFSIDPATDKPTAVMGWILKTTSEIAEAQEEWLRLRLIRGHATVGSGGAAATARPDSSVDTAYGGSCRVLDDVIASAGTAANLWSDAFQVRAGSEVFFPPEQWKWFFGAEFMVLRLMAAAADVIDMSGTLSMIEYP